MLNTFVFLPIPLAIIWVILVDQVTIESFLIGYIISVALALRIAANEDIRFSIAKLPTQAISLIIYCLLMFWNIFLSGIDVMLRVLSVRPYRPGIIAVPVQDSDEDPIVAGGSAHSITITPGQLVVDFDGAKTMYVHCLDAEESAQTLDSDQTMRLKWIKRILGDD